MSSIHPHHPPPQPQPAAPGKCWPPQVTLIVLTSLSLSSGSPQASLGGAGNGPVTPAPLTTANVGSCKYADSNVGSPQDLSTTSSGGTPQPPGMGPGLKSPDSDIEDSEPTSPLSPDPKGEGGASSSATSTKKEDSKSTPPQIYPWMKRVHLGQSKLLFISQFFRCVGPTNFMNRFLSSLRVIIFDIGSLLSRSVFVSPSVFLNQKPKTV